MLHYVKKSNAVGNPTLYTTRLYTNVTQCPCPHLPRDQTQSRCQGAGAGPQRLNSGRSQNSYTEYSSQPILVRRFMYSSRVGTSTCRCPTSDMRARQLCILGSCGAAVSGHMSVSNTSQSSSGPLLLQASPTATADTHAMRSLHARCSTPNSKPSRLTCSECAYAAWMQRARPHGRQRPVWGSSRSPYCEPHTRSTFATPAVLCPRVVQYAECAFGRQHRVDRLGGGAALPFSCSRH